MLGFVWLILKLNQMMQLIPDKNHLRTTVVSRLRKKKRNHEVLITALTPYAAQWKEFYEIHLLFGIDEHSASNPMQYNVILDISLRTSGRRVWQLKKLRIRGLLRAPFCFTVRVRVRVVLYTSNNFRTWGVHKIHNPFSS